MKGPYDDGNVLYLDHISIDILSVILYYGFAKCYHSRDLS